MGNRLNVLLVDDNEDDYIITRDLFSETEDSGINLEWIISYDQARERISQRCHDVYIFDYGLGEHNGVELLQWAMEQNVPGPVIMLTGQRDRAIDLQAMQAGATDYLVKGRTDGSLLERTVRYSAEHARRLAALRDLAIRDELTGLYNRREMDRLLKAEVSRCLRYGHPVGLVVIDIDNFKLINDTFGHVAGDKVLRTISQLLAENLRSPDSIARYGGDELVVILPETSEREALLVVERLRTVVATHDFAMVLPVELRSALPSRLALTISLGVACADAGAYTDESLFADADQALYQAKQCGRNHIVVAAHPVRTLVPLVTQYKEGLADYPVIRQLALSVSDTKVPAAYIDAGSS
jgi:diguanylate cyclase (GGDEF)-like protein